MSTQLDTDIATLVGELADVPCDHVDHAKPGTCHDAGPATHYVKASCPKCDKTSGIYAACNGFISVALAGVEFICPRCLESRPSSDFITILGPVNK